MLSVNKYFISISIAINNLWFLLRNNGIIANNSGNLKIYWAELTEMCILGGNSIPPPVCTVFEWCQVVITLLNQINCPDVAMSITNFLVTDSISIVQVHLECWLGQHNKYGSSEAATFEKLVALSFLLRFSKW